MGPILMALALAVPVQDVHGHGGPPRQVEADRVPLNDNLGSHTYEVTTSVPRAQAFFDQGLRSTTRSTTRSPSHADETWIQDRRPGPGVYTAGYYPHNYDFMAFAAAMAGRAALAVESADRVTELVPAEMLGAPGLAFLQHWLVRPLQIRVRFGLWDEVMAAPAPPAGLPHARAIWH